MEYLLNINRKEKKESITKIKNNLIIKKEKYSKFINCLMNLFIVN